MTYPPPHQVATVDTWLATACKQCEQAGISCKVISNGGTPSLHELPADPVATEYRVGTYIYNDRSMVSHAHCTLADCALTVLATVVSVPAAGRAIIDAGSKLLSSDLLGLAEHGEVLGLPEVRVTALSEEHGHLSMPLSMQLAVGDRLRIVPNHACVVSNLVDEVVALRAGKVEQRIKVQARGRSD